MTAALADPQLERALHSCVASLQYLANYELEAPIAQKLEALFDRKEFLNETDHNELLSLVDFVRKRSVEKLQAQAALQEIGAFLPAAMNGK